MRKTIFILLTVTLFLCCLAIGCGGKTEDYCNKKGHTYVVIEEERGTCISYGYIVEKCNRCDNTKRTSLPSLGHDNQSETIVSAKCGIEGMIKYYCTREGCDYSYNRTIPALKHQYDESEIITPAKCGKEGVIRYFCTRQDCSHSFDEAITALEHKYTRSEVNKPALCETEGVRIYYCTQEDCHSSYSEKIPALKHDFDKEVTVEPCTRVGEAKLQCKRRTCNYVTTEIIPAVGYHNCDKKGACLTCGAENVCSKNFVVSGSAITGYNGNDLDVVIPSMIEGVVITTISSFAFSANTNIKSVYIPDTITTIGYGAFQTCMALSNIRLPSNLKSIGMGAFQGTKITSIFIPSTLASIEEYAFNLCYNLETIYYQGTEDDWYEIDIKGHNVELVSSDIMYNYVREE